MLGYVDTALTWLGIGVAYTAAIVMIGGGGYIAVMVPSKPLRILGVCLMMLGGDVAIYTKGKTVGAAQCHAEWRAADDKAAADRQAQENNAQSDADATSTQQAADLAAQNEALQKQVDAYADTIKNSKDAACILTDDDVRELRGIAGGTTARGKDPK